MTYRLIDETPPDGTIDHVTFVAFLPGGACAARPGPALISGALLPGESIDLDASARIPLQQAGFYRQRVRAFALDGTHLYAWIDGDRHPHRHPLTTDHPCHEPAKHGDGRGRRPEDREPGRQGGGPVPPHDGDPGRPEDRRHSHPEDREAGRQGGGPERYEDRRPDLPEDRPEDHDDGLGAPTTDDLVIAAPEELADLLDRRGLPLQAQAVRDAVISVGALDESDHYADVLRLLEPAYLRADTAEAGSGFGGTAEQWRASRQMIVDGIDRDGSFLDVGCANGLLMESVHHWAAEHGHHIEPYGIDLSPRLVALAQARLPRWADRITAGNAMHHVPADGRRFTFVHVLVHLAPANRLADLLRHALHTLVEPGGRLLVSRYCPAGGTDRTDVADIIERLGFPVAGVSHTRTTRETGSTVWIDRPPPSPTA